jgi:hypothetical protein
MQATLPSSPQSLATRIIGGERDLTAVVLQVVVLGRWRKVRSDEVPTGETCARKRTTLLVTQMRTHCGLPSRPSWDRCVFDSSRSLTGVRL